MLSLLALTICAGEAPSKLPAAADRAYRTYVVALDKSYQAETDKLRVQLKKEMDAATKKGDLDAAIAIKDLLTKVDSGRGLEDARALQHADALGDVKTAEALTIKVDPAKDSNIVKVRFNNDMKIRVTAVAGRWANAPSTSMCDPLVGDRAYQLEACRGEATPAPIMRLMVKIGKDPAEPVELNKEYTGKGQPSFYANDSGLFDNLGIVTVTYEIVQ